MLNRFFRAFSSLLAKRQGAKPSLAGLRQLLLQQGSFDASWYLAQYPDVAQEAGWAADPLLHYLQIGWRQGKKPVPDFDGAWYLAQYADVAQAGVNPYVHYLLHGRAEKRLPFELAPEQDSATTEFFRQRLVRHLWGGHSQAALRWLARLYNGAEYDAELRFFAAWHAARWYYFVQDYKQALALAELISSLGDDYRWRKITVMIYAFCYMQLGDNAQASTLLQHFLQLNPADSDMGLALANTYQTDEQRLQATNAVLAQQGLVPIRLLQPGKPLCFDNICADAPEVDSPVKVTVIMPVHNAGLHIENALRSLRKQSWRNLEVIVVDDCSTDDTLERARAVSAKDPRIKVLAQTQNGGAYRARNTGLAHASGDFITTHDGDDWSHPQKIELQMQFLLANPKVKGVCTYWIRALPSLHVSQNWRLNPELIHWSHSSFIFRKQVVSEIGAWDPVLVGGDTEFIWRVQARYGEWAVKTIHKGMPLAFALDDEGSLTRSKATHVKTIHYGLRHIYRSAAQYWHKQQPKQLQLQADALQRAFPAPSTMLSRAAVVQQVDVLYIADFTLDAANKHVFERAVASVAAGQKLALLHWPAFYNPLQHLKPAYFELLQQPNVQAIVFGQAVSATEVVVSSERLLRYVPEQLPDISCRQGVCYVNESKHYAVKTPAIQQRFNQVFGCSAKVLPVAGEQNQSH